MTLLSIAIPSYNSEAYLHYCVHSLVMGGDKVEILIINDGSTIGLRKLQRDLLINFRMYELFIKRIRAMAELLIQGYVRLRVSTLKL